MPSISFSRNRKVRIAPRIPEEEKGEIWYDSQDIARIEICNIISARRVMEKSTSECPRGLESFMEAERDERREQVKSVIRSVLAEQEQQQHEGILDSEALAILSQRLSLISRRAARATGKADENESKDLADDINNWSYSSLGQVDAASSNETTEKKKKRPLSPKSLASELRSSQTPRRISIEVTDDSTKLALC